MNVNSTASKWRLSAPSSKMRWLPVLILLACMLGPGCATHGTPQIAGTPPELLELLSPPPRFDPELLQAAPDALPQLTNDDVPSMVRNHVQSAAQYHDLREKHVGLAAQAKQRDADDAARIERARKALERK